VDEAEAKNTRSFERRGLEGFYKNNSPKSSLASGVAKAKREMLKKGAIYGVRKKGS
jgi:hypothetical protein